MISANDFALSVLNSFELKGENDEEKIQHAFSIYIQAYETAISYKKQSETSTKKRTKTDYEKVTKAINSIGL